MNLKVGDTVHFNVKLNEKQAPQVKRIVKATLSADEKASAKPSKNLPVVVSGGDER